MNIATELGWLTALEPRLQLPEGGWAWGVVGAFRLGGAEALVLGGGVAVPGGTLLAQSLQRVEAGHYLASGAVFTPCDCGGTGGATTETGWQVPVPRRALWRLEAARLEVRFASGAVASGAVASRVESSRADRLSSLGWVEAEAEGAGAPRGEDAAGGTTWLDLEKVWLKAGPLPLLYLPFWRMPIQDGQVVGLQVPGFRRTDDGLLLHLPAAWRFTPRLKVSGGLTYNPSRGVQPDVTLWLGRGSEPGRLAADWLYDRSWVASADRSSPTTSSRHSPQRWSFSWRQAGPILPGVSGTASVQEVSDAEYLRDFGRSLETRSQDVLRSVLGAGMSREGLQVGAWGERLRGVGTEEIQNQTGRLAVLEGWTRGPLLGGRAGTLRLEAAGEAFVEGPAGAVGNWLTGAPERLAEEGAVYVRARPAARLNALAWRAIPLETRLAWEGDWRQGLSAADGGIGRQALRLESQAKGAFSRTFSPGNTRVYHRIEPAVWLGWTLWEAEAAGYRPPVGEVLPEGRFARLGLAQEVKISGLEGELTRGRLNVEWGKALEGGQAGSALRLRLAWGARSGVRLMGLWDPVSRTWRQTVGEVAWRGGPGSLRVGYVQQAAGEVLTPEGGRLSLEAGVREVVLRGGLRLDGLGPEGWERWLRGWQVEASARALIEGSLAGGYWLMPRSRRLGVRYGAAQGCLQVELFVAWDEDQGVPELGGQLEPRLGW